jgi:hypothetical protein
MFAKGFQFTAFDPRWEANPRYWCVEFIITNEYNITIYICRSSQSNMLLDWTEDEIISVLEHQKQLRAKYPQAYLDCEVQ